jgi:hypothetical protein
MLWSVASATGLSRTKLLYSSTSTPLCIATIVIIAVGHSVAKKLSINTVIYMCMSWNAALAVGHLAAKVLNYRHFFAAHLFPCSLCSWPFQTQTALRRHLANGLIHASGIQRSLPIIQSVNSLSVVYRVPSIALDDTHLNTISDQPYNACFETYELGCMASKLPCNHWRHTSCIEN